MTPITGTMAAVESGDRGGKRRRRRKPTLAGVIKQASKAGKAVKSAVVEDGKVTLVFGEPTADTNSNEWDEVLRHGKH